MANIEQFREHRWVKGREDVQTAGRSEISPIRHVFCGSDVACTTIRQDFRTEVLLLYILIFHF